MQKLAQSTSVFAKFLHSFISTFTFSHFFEAGLIRPNIRTWRCRRPSIISRAFIFIGALIDFSYGPVKLLICKSTRRAMTSGLNRWRPMTSKLAITIAGGTSNTLTNYLLIYITDSNCRLTFHDIFIEYRSSSIWKYF